MLALLDNGRYLILEPHLNKAVSFIKDKDLDVFEGKAFSVLNVIKETTRRGDYEIRNALQVTPLLTHA